jgi:hypothetical protein
MVEISKTADIGGINPKDYANKPAVFTIAYNEEISDTVIEEVQAKKDGSPMKRYTLNLIDEQGNERKLSYLWARDLAVISRKYGEDTTKWGGYRIELSAKKNKADYYDPVIEV